MRAYGLATLCIAVVWAAALPAEATITTVDFKVSGDWYGPVGGAIPFRFDPTSTIFGIFTVDNPKDSDYTVVYGGGITNVLIKVGTRTFTLADLVPVGVIVQFYKGAPYQWQLPFAGGTDFSLGAGTALWDGPNWLGCGRSCTVQLDPLQPTLPDNVPEPATWALMIGGFGLAGATLRRRRAAVAT